MRRAPLVLAGTLTGLVVVLGYRTPEVGRLSASAASSSPSSPGSSSTGSTSGSSVGSKSYDGQVAQTQWGPVQVRITVASGKVTDVTAVQLPGGDPHSSEISAYAEPMLRQQALAAQSATIDGVSGASYTSSGYVQSLQSALDAAGI